MESKLSINIYDVTENANLLDQFGLLNYLHQKFLKIT